ncbi:MAG TPA: hydrogenase maturation nickel metallochaperone HypA [Planctomycetota bacterium]|nr:hydrogenase maturation nickel metallochaperone HypA [Planctomycetota bacterium]
MHEMAVTQEIVDLVCERAGGSRVRRVVVEIGKLSMVVPDAVRFCFELCAEGTALEGAALEIEEPPGRGRCRSCGAETALRTPYDGCACGSPAMEWLSGQALRVREMEVY